jgi:membrane protein
MSRLGKTLPLVEFGRMVVQRFEEDRCLQIAASLTFTTLLAIVPIITVALTVLSAFPVFRELIGHLGRFLLENVLPAPAETVAAYTEQFSRNAARLTAVGASFLLVTALMMLMTIDRAFNQIWRVPRPRSTMQRVLIYWALLTVGPVLFGAALAATSWLLGASLGLARGVPYAGEVLLKLVPLFVTAIAFTLLYVLMPNRPVAVRDALAGGCLAALAFEAMKQVFGAYLSLFSTYTLVYGAFASVPVVLLWIYLSWVIVLFGAAACAVMPEWRERASQAQSAPGSQFLDALQILRVLWEAHRTGETVALSRLHAIVKLPLDRTEQLLEAMSAAHWVGQLDRGWVLIRDAAQISVADVYRLFVFRTGARLPVRPSGQELDRLALELAAAVEANLGLSLEALFESSVAPGARVAPLRAQG